MPRVWIASALIALRIGLIFVTFGVMPLDASGALGSDAHRLMDIAQAQGDPYRDFEVEFPPVSVAFTDLLARHVTDVRALAWRLAWAMLACEIIVMFALWRGWSDEVAVAYLLIGTPMAWFIYVRADLLSVMLAVVGVLLARRDHPVTGAMALVAGAFAKVWPVLLLPLLAAQRRWRALVTGIVVGLGGLLAWIAAFGADGPRQVLTFRGATGWGIESTWGLPLWLLLGRPARFEQGAWRVGYAPPLLRATLAVCVVAGAVIVWSRASEVTMYGAAPAAVIALTLLLSPHTSLQWVAWLLPFVAIAGDPGARGWAAIAAASATGVYVAASLGGAWSTAAAVCEFLRVVAVAAVLVTSWRALQVGRPAIVHGGSTR